MHGKEVRHYNIQPSQSQYDHKETKAWFSQQIH